MSRELPYPEVPEAISARTASSSAFREELGRRIVRLRESKRWSRADLARELGIPQGRLSRWERGVHEPPLEMLAPLARSLSVSVDELVTGQRMDGRVLSPAERERVGWHLMGLRRLLIAR